MKHTSVKILFTSILFAGLPVGAVTTMPITTVPLDVALNTVNSLFVIDDSGSMDWEILVDSKNNSVLQWVSKKFWTIENGKIKYQSESSFNNLYAYLFPSVYQKDGRVYENDSYPVIPPTSEYAFLRNSAYNQTYYNPKITYKPWAPVYVNGQLKEFKNANPSAARSHPYLNKDGAQDIDCTNAANCLIYNLTTDYGDSVAEGHVFTYPSGGIISVPASIPDPSTGLTKKVQLQSWGSWSDLDKATTNKGTYKIPFFPATYWVNDSSCSADAYPSANWLTCARAPDGTQMRRYDIVNGTQFSGNSFTLPDSTIIKRTRSEELQNFANWFTYYRKRNLLLAGGVGQAIEGVQSKYSRLLAGTVKFKSLSGKSTIYDFTQENNASNGRSLLNSLYGLQVNSGTPTLEALNYAACQMNQGGGDRSECSSSVKSNFKYDNPFVDEFITQETMRCSANTAFILTDGYANDVTADNSLYTQAKAFYENFYSWSKTGGNTLNTYGITLGALGQKFDGSGTIPGTFKDSFDKNGKLEYTAAQNYALTAGEWPTPAANSDSAIDDLWRATLYSKGKLLSATDSDTLDSAMNNIITSMFSSGSQTGLSVSNPNITQTDRTAILTGYNSGDWTGKIKAHYIDLNTGLVDLSTTLWSAHELLDAKDSSNRIIATWSEGGKPFKGDSLTTSVFNSKDAVSDGADVINYLRGDKSKETTHYRKRNHLLGDIINSTPVFVSGAKADYSDSSYQSFKKTIQSRTKMVYVGANDGMMHAFDGETGQEKWAYVPGLLHSKLSKLAKPSYVHDFYVNGHITTWDVQFSDGSWHTMLIGGLREGGKGYYAIDITNPDFATEADLAKKVKWEYATDGLSYGRPYIAQLSNGKWVVLLTSGYNTSSGAGRLHVVDIETGLNLDTSNQLVIPQPDAGEPYDQVGLAQVSALAKSDSSLNGEISWVYAGDLNGNVWRFDLSNKDSSKWGYKKLADSLRAQGSKGQPITTAPEIGYIDTSANNCTKTTGSSVCQYSIPEYQNAADIKDRRLMVYVGTGLLLHSSDYNKSETDNGFFAFEDANDSLVINEGVCANLNCLVGVGLGQIEKSQGFNNWGTTDNDTEASGVMDWWNVMRKSFNWDSDGDGKLEQRAGRGWYFKFSETGGERVINDPVYINGMITFTTVMKSDNRFSNLGSCETAYSALYRVGADRGGAVDGYLPRINLDFGIVSGITPYSTGDKTMGGYQVGENPGGVPLPNSPSSKGEKKKYGWRELTR